MVNFELTTLTDYSDEAILNEMRRVAELLKAERLTREKFNEISKVYSSTYTKRFGSWANALDLAGISAEQAPRIKRISMAYITENLQKYVVENPGIPITVEKFSNIIGFNKYVVNKTVGNWKTFIEQFGLDPVPLGRRYTDKECFENIVTLWTHYGRQPNFGELKQPPSTVGPKAYIRRWGGWRNALGAFIEYINSNNEFLLYNDDVVQSDKFLNDESNAENAAEIQSRSISLTVRYRVLVRDKFRCTIAITHPLAARVDL